MMSVAAALIFVAALVLSPVNGLAVSFWRRSQLKREIIRDDILGMLYRWHEVVGRDLGNPLSAADILSALGPSVTTRNALRSLLREGSLVRAGNGALHLSERGILEAAAVVRSHRLWEAYLAKHLGLPKDHLHAPSERAEHFIGRALARELQQDLSASKDPHGRSIP
jgi:Mn-dependent DtxR family transcriptional regulator